MIKKDFFAIEILFSIILLRILIFLINPYNIIMPTELEALLIGSLITIFMLFSILIWKEGARDERENAYRSQAGRVSFLVGGLILVIGIGYQTVTYMIDPWLVLALIGMILTKIFSHIYWQIKG